MKLTIHGPNLNDQSKGTFHVHTAECRDNKKEVQRNGSVEPITKDFASTVEVVDYIYSDVIAENPGDSPEDSIYVSDFHFAPCIKNLPFKVEQKGSTYARELDVILTAAKSDAKEVSDQNFNLATVNGMLETLVDEDYLETASTEELDDLVEAYFTQFEEAFSRQLHNRKQAFLHAKTALPRM